MLAFIYIFILALNVVAVVLTYHCLGKQIDRKSKGIFIIVAIAIIYMLVTFVYWIATKDIKLEIDTDIGKNLITFTFVPVNAIVVIPFLASSYKHLKSGDLKPIPFRNRAILMGIVLIFMLIFEFFYFRDIQNGIVSLLNNIKK